MGSASNICAILLGSGECRVRLRASHLTNCTYPPDPGTTAGLPTLHGFLRPSGHAIQVFGAALTLPLLPVSLPQ
jgi:hypothetical protein